MFFFFKNPTQGLIFFLLIILVFASCKIPESPKTKKHTTAELADAVVQAQEQQGLDQLGILDNLKKDLVQYMIEQGITSKKIPDNIHPINLVQALRICYDPPNEDEKNNSNTNITIAYEKAFSKAYKLGLFRIILVDPRPPKSKLGKIGIDPANVKTMIKDYFKANPEEIKNLFNNHKF